MFNLRTIDSILYTLYRRYNIFQLTMRARRTSTQLSLPFDTPSKAEIRFAVIPQGIYSALSLVSEVRVVLPGFPPWEPREHQESETRVRSDM